jgi:hypothetical protein
MNQEVKAKWLEALRSGKYGQYRETALRHEDRFCCLGVLCDLAVREGIGTWGKDVYGITFYQNGSETKATGVLPQSLIDWAGLSNCNPDVPHQGDRKPIASLNDIEGLDFPELAELIEVYL